MVLFETGVRIWRGLVTRNRFSGFARFLLVAFFMIPVSAHSQAWSGILDPSRAIDWSFAGVQGGIPNYTHVCQTVNPSADATGATDATNINSALSTCAGLASISSPQVVLLAAGRFYSKASIGPPVGSHYIVLRGAGPANTIIKWVGTSSACSLGGGIDLCFSGNDNGGETGTTAWVGTNHSIRTYTQGASVLDLTSTTNIASGMILILTQRNDSMGLCPQSGGTGNCSSIRGLTNNGSGTVTAVTSAPYPDIVNGAKVYVGTRLNHSYDACGGYQSGQPPWTVLTATTTATNTIFTYSDPNTLSSPTANCNPGYVSVDTGGLYTCNVQGGCMDAGASSGTLCPDTTTRNQCAPGETSQRSQVEAHLVTAVCTAAGVPNANCLAANEVVIDGQVMAPNWRTSQKPSVWWRGTVVSDHVGVESLTVDATNDGGVFATIKFQNTSNFWVKNIRSLFAYGIHIDAANATRGSIVDSYFFGGQHVGPESYGIDLQINTSYVLIQNNILQNIGGALIVEQAYGNVWAYNYLFQFIQPLANGMNGMLNINHGFSGAQLAEGNDANGCKADATHGTSWGVTFFRNRCRGQDTPMRTLFVLGGADESFQRIENWIGNVLGTTNTASVVGQTTYAATAPLPPLPSGAIYNLGTSGYVTGGAPAFTGLLDPVTANTLFRWGNYDVVTGAVRWCGTGAEANCGGTSEVPTTGVAYINGNAVPASHTLPASFYLSAQPQFWTMASGYGPTPPWPAIGPDVTGGTAPDGAGGFSYPIPAQLCYQHTPVDPSYQKAYSVKDASWSSGTATLATSTNALAVGDTISVSGVAPSGYNGTWQVKAVTSNTVSFAVPRNLPAHLSGGTSGGTMTSRNILLFNAAKCYAAYGGSSTLAPPSKLVAHPQ